MEPIIKMHQIVKIYNIGKENELEILHGIDLEILPGELVAVVGESGSGKSTLMNIMGVLDVCTSGEYYLNGAPLVSKTKDEMSEIRNKEIGFIFQNFHLIPRTTALENVALPMLYAGISKKESLLQAQQLLKLVNMEDRMYHDPSRLSGGQKQRVAIARALSNNPSIILADEPTGALDVQTSNQIFELLQKLNDEGKTVVIVTHSMDLAQKCKRIITIQDGRIIADEKRETI